jgi:hypothetical protein
MAGLRAVTAASGAGADVVLLEEAPQAGGAMAITGDSCGGLRISPHVVCDASGVEILSFLSVGRLDDSGLIASYVAYDSRPPVGSASPF